MLLSCFFNHYKRREACQNLAVIFDLNICDVIALRSNLFAASLQQLCRKPSICRYVNVCSKLAAMFAGNLQ